MFILWKPQCIKYPSHDYKNLNFPIRVFFLGSGGRLVGPWLSPWSPDPHPFSMLWAGTPGCRLPLNYGSKSIAAECHLLRAADQNPSGSHASSLIERLFYASKQFIVFLHAWCSFTTLINKICKTTKKLNPKSSSDASVIVNQYPASVLEGKGWGPLPL